MMNDDDELIHVLTIFDLAKMRRDVHEFIDAALLDETAETRARMHEKADACISRKLLPMLEAQAERQAGSRATH